LEGKDDGEDSDDEEMREKIRCYQLNRLKYFYAVAQFDSAQTVNHVYEQCDGLEYECSSTKFDLRLVPEEETFDEADVTDSCTRRGLDLDKYEPQLFINTALQQGKVHCTWDETDPQREKVMDKVRKRLLSIDYSCDGVGCPMSASRVANMILFPSVILDRNA
jgi:hypothetical protein